ncbi:MAG: hypothetical protein KY434_05270 [Actinobacteria bacterium]|nr:hypothetical protein [Actinomycetota bacterium]
MPGWVKGFILAGILAAVLLIVTFVAGGGHGPSRHLSGGAGTGAAAVAGQLLPADHG